MGWWSLSGNKKQKGTIIQSLINCGLYNKFSGDEDHILNIREIMDYVMPKPKSEFHLERDRDSDKSVYD